MFCPVCKSEFRTGFTRCEGCDADLVESLDQVAEGSEENGIQEAAASAQLVDFCGFLELRDARQARDELRSRRIGSEVVIRDTAPPIPGQPAKEEFWLRVPVSNFREVAAILGYDSAEE